MRLTYDKQNYNLMQKVVLELRTTEKTYEPMS